MPDEIFKYLLNYIHHGMKKLTSIPLAAKRATSVAVALLTIFTEQGPLSILQSDNGGEFSNHVHDYVGHWMLLDDDFVDLVIKELMISGRNVRWSEALQDILSLMGVLKGSIKFSRKSWPGG
jgi:hypothetical protein